TSVLGAGGRHGRGSRWRAAMAAEGTAGKGKAKRGGVLGLLLPLVLALAAGGGGFAGVSATLLPGPIATFTSLATPAPPPPWAEWETPSYLELPPFTVSLGPRASAATLRLELVLDVAPGAEDLVAEAEPRIVAALVRFLRAVDERDFSEPALMLRLQAQMLRRVDLAVPRGSVRAVLVQEFVFA
ncbi:MAG: flagellar basal body-associated FliL family protein, partial [Pseudomonadota bacterium]